MTSSPLSRPSPFNMPRQKTVPPAPAAVSGRRHAFRTAPRRGYRSAVTFADTGVLLSAARSRYLVEQVVVHYGKRLRISDLVLDELRHRGSATVDSTRQLEKNAASEAANDVERLGVAIEGLSVVDAPVFDEVVAQLRALAKVRARAIGDGADDADRHAGEAASISCCVRLASGGVRTVLLTNDGDASVIADARGIPSRHFGHVLNEFVCADRLDAVAAFARFTNAARVTTPPAASCPRHSTDLECTKSQTSCSACDVVDS